MDITKSQYTDVVFW